MGKDFPAPVSGACDVCWRAVKCEVLGSPLGPISYAVCDECAEHLAVPLWVIFRKLDFNGGLTEAPRDTRYASFHNGRYISWNEALKLYALRDLP
jgi:hypothetical protein